MSAQQVIIIGAGACGLAIAHGLKKSGIHFKIFEAEEESTFRPREWTMALHWGLPMLQSLLPSNLAARLKKDASVDPSLDYTKYPNNTISVYDGVSGDHMKDISIEGEYLRVSRRKLRALLTEGISINYGHALSKISTDNDATVTAFFTNGTKYTGTLLIGADGPRSTVRQHIFGTAKAASTPLGIVYTNVSFRYPNSEKAMLVRRANPISSFTVHPSCIALVSIQDVPDPRKPKSWRFQLVVSWKGSVEKDLTNEEKHKIVKERAAVLQEPFRSAILWMPEDVDVQFSDLSCWIPEKWSLENCLVTLAGDSFHSMPPNRGQGLNHAINDAYNFVAAVKDIEAGKGTQTEIIQKYSDEVVERGAKETLLSRKTAFLTLEYDDFKNSAIMKHGLTRAPYDERGTKEAES